MDFELVIKTLISEFARLKIRSAAIGGFALGVLGALRQTMDLGFLVHRDDLEKLDKPLTVLAVAEKLYVQVAQKDRRCDAREKSILRLLLRTARRWRT